MCNASMILKIGHLFCQLIKSQQNQMKIFTYFFWETFLLLLTVKVIQPTSFENPMGLNLGPNIKKIKKHGRDD